MNTLVKVISEKLKILGYTESVSNSIIQKLDISLIENNINEVEDYSDYVKVYQYDEPSVEINRVCLNINNKFIETSIIEGDIKIIAAENVFGIKFVVADYLLSKRCGIIGISNDFNVEIHIYSPNQKVQVIYDGKTYEQTFKKERDSVTLEYKEAFEKNKKLPVRKIEEVLTMLVSDYIIDEMIVGGLNPRLKMYDDPQKYAENITKYSLRFINDRTNRIEIYEKEPQIRRVGADIIPGLASNDPYIRLGELGRETNFLLNKTSYYWLKDNGKGQEEIAIYTATNKEQFSTYGELRKNSPEIKEIVDDIIRQFKRVTNTTNDYREYIEEIVKTLNIELLKPNVEVIRSGMVNDSALIIPIAYRYNFINDPVEFEERLYISIEDSIGRNYKYKIAEPILDDLTRIGNKLEYTDKKRRISKKTVNCRF